MAALIEHFVFGSSVRLKRFRLGLPAEIEVKPMKGGLVLRQVLDANLDIDLASRQMAALAASHGVEYDGRGHLLGEANDSHHDGQGLGIHSETFTARTGIGGGHGFAFPLPDGKFGHAVFLGSDRQGYLLLDISTLVTDRPADPATLKCAPKRYRQPIMVWHTPFAVRSLPRTVPVTELPAKMVFRSSVGWPDPEEVALLEERFGITAPLKADFDDLLNAMARLGERLPGISGYSLVTVRIGQAGTLEIIEDHTLLHFTGNEICPMPWQPATIDEIMAILTGAPDMIEVRDKVT